MRAIVLSLLLFQLTGLAGMGQSRRNPNPPTPGFDVAGSDTRAIQIADAVMVAMGGRAAWDETQQLAWNFDGIRKFVWDKWSGDVRIDNLHDDQTILMNINNDMGRVFRNGEELTKPDSVAKYVKMAKRQWISDSYWLLMPFRLKDSGVTLKYAGDELTQAGKPADVIQLTSKGNSLAAGSRYKIWVDKKTHLISQWAYFTKLTDKTPAFILPWEDYEPYGNILLSSDRGKHELTDIMVFTGLPGEVFSDFTRTDLSRYQLFK